MKLIDNKTTTLRKYLMEYINKGHGIERTPFGLHAVVAAREATPPGLVFVRICFLVIK